MIALLSTSASFHLFSPLLISAALAMFVFMLGRLVATRKFTRALDDDDLPAPSASDAPGPIHPDVSHLARDAPMASAPRTSQPPALDGAGTTSLDAPDLDEPAAIERVPTRKFVRARDSKRRSARGITETTVRCKRMYIETNDVVEC